MPPRLALPAQASRMPDDIHAYATRCIAALLGVGSNVMAWATSLDVGMVVSGITIVGSAVVYLIVLSIEKIGTARRKDERERAEQEIELAKLRESAMKGSLAAQLAEANENLLKIRRSNHEINNRLQSETSRSDELQEQLTEANRQLARANGQIIALTAEVEKLRVGQQRATRDIKHAIAEGLSDHGSRHDLPAAGADESSAATAGPAAPHGD